MMDGISSRRRRRRHYRLLEDESDSPLGSSVHRRSPEGASEVLCDKCVLRHRRRLATKRCLDCEKNLCENCADHDRSSKTGWIPVCLVQCFRFFFPCTEPVTHSVLDLAEIDDTRGAHDVIPKWARYTSSSDVFVIPRITRDSLRGRSRRRPRVERNYGTESDLQNKSKSSGIELDQKEDGPIQGNVRLQYKYQTQNGVPTKTVYTEHTFSSSQTPRISDIGRSSNPLNQNQAYLVEEPPDTCPVCLEDIPTAEARNFACEHCIHTKCLLELILRMDFDFGVKCPVCNQMTDVKNYYVPREQWVHEFPLL